MVIFHIFIILAICLIVAGGPDPLEGTDVHLHFPAGAVTKDGPSAGVTIVTCLASLFSGRLVRSDVAMTGEITLRGLVLPVRGLHAGTLPWAAVQRNGPINQRSDRVSRSRWVGSRTRCWQHTERA